MSADTPASIKVLMQTPGQYQAIATAAQAAGMAPSVFLRYLGLRAYQELPPENREPLPRPRPDMARLLGRVG